MQQLGFDSGVRAHGECQLPLWPGQLSGALDQLAPHGTQLFKALQRSALFGGVAFSSTKAVACSAPCSNTTARQ